MVLSEHLGQIVFGAGFYRQGVSIDLPFPELSQRLPHILDTVFPFVLIVVIGFSIRNQDDPFVFCLPAVEPSSGVAERGAYAGISLGFYGTYPVFSGDPFFIEVLQGQVGGIVPGFGKKLSIEKSIDSSSRISPKSMATSFSTSITRLPAA